VGRQVRLEFVPALRPRRGHALVQSLFEGGQKLGFDCRWLRGEPRPDAWVVLYGLGAPDRVQFANRARLIAFDAGYWDRHGDARRFRVSVGGFHCPHRIMEGPQPNARRWLQAKLPIGDGRSPTGPILLVGNGPKSNAVGANGWTARKSLELRAAIPGKRVLYRPKPKKPIESGVRHDGVAIGAIDDVLRSVSLVVCRHSNVAVDACRAGVPVVCDDGAAASIYPHRLEDREKQPDRATREAFLHRLAWWQWSQQECADGSFWRWMSGELREVR
jgi:hypothetical protein